MCSVDSPLISAASSLLLQVDLKSYKSKVPQLQTYLSNDPYCSRWQKQIMFQLTLFQIETYARLVRKFNLTDFIPLLDLKDLQVLENVTKTIESVGGTIDLKTWMVVVKQRDFEVKVSTLSLLKSRSDMLVERLKAIREDNIIIHGKSPISDQVVVL
jgi:hypothetical protein